MIKSIEINKKGIEQNKEKTIENRALCDANEKAIKENKDEIDELKRNAVPYIVFESTQARSDRIIHRLIFVLIVAVALLVITNAIWIYAWSQKTDDTSIFNKDGVTNVIGNDGTIGG